VVRPQSMAPVHSGAILRGSNLGQSGRRCTKNAAGIRGVLVNGQCFNPFSVVPGGQSPISAPVGEAQMGRFGAGLPPMDVPSSRRQCLPGMVLGKDGLCYNTGKGGISNKDREWPKGRKPLGTPGELAALAKAASFGRRMENTVKRMQKIGVLKKPATRRAPKAAQKLLTPGVVQIQQE